MAAWKKGERHKSWASNGNVAVYIFSILFTVWVAFQVWSRFGGGPPPTGLDPMVMAALGVAVTTKSVEKKAEERDVKSDVAETKERVWDLEELARKSHPDVAAEKIKPPPEPTEGGEVNV